MNIVEIARACSEPGVARTAAKIALLMAPGYDPVQADWIAQTARCNPGEPIVFDSALGGQDQVTWTDGLWEIRATYLAP